MRPPFQLAGKIALLMLLALIAWAVYAWNFLITPSSPEKGIGIFIYSIAGSALILMFWLSAGILCLFFSKIDNRHVYMIFGLYSLYFCSLGFRPGLIGILFFALPIALLVFVVSFVAKSSRTSRQHLMDEWRSAQASVAASSSSADKELQ